VVETADAGTAIPACFTVSVLMACRQVEHRGWSVPRWELLGIVPGREAEAGGGERQVVHQESGLIRVLWRGLRLELFRDAAESYWFNLTSSTPSLFLVCREDTEGGQAPFLVTADHDEATAHLESEDGVFSTPIPPEIYQGIERFVVQHYQPGPRKKRKRKNWSEELDQDARPKRVRPDRY